MIIALDDVPPKCEAKLEYIRAEDSFRTRMMELGFIQGTKIKVMYEGVTGGTRAYEIRKIVIALRNSDAAKIYVSVSEGI